MQNKVRSSLKWGPGVVPQVLGILFKDQSTSLIRKQGQGQKEEQKIRNLELETGHIEVGSTGIKI